jgi:hypothetical protein
VAVVVVFSAGVTAVTLYRFYKVGENGRITEAPEIVDCADDDAVEKAKKLAVAHGIEIWDLARRVAAIPKT